ncbi:hypothetical protein ISTM_315 [Insectomime virus]|uniref:Uncharacterized protein n=1 Tax=Tunisvirus fontaine2 TaxID=1421067 RepID=V9SHF6_9VIRU|nr:hypothetical protein D1R32_gp001 [Tunisvirus fontaine2]AHA46213.1 hypothetical protein ISTM_315 [Insectomime virus]AHC55202.1 hypothetical protein TNS_ORF484 [Tunisvirus fontaine2]
MASVLLPKVLDILEGFLIQRNEVQVEVQDDIHLFTQFCGSLCHWQENEDGTFQESPTSPQVSEEEMLQILRERLNLHPSLPQLCEKRKKYTSGFHLESVLLPLVLPLVLEDCCLEEDEVGICYAYSPGDVPCLEELDEDATWVTLYLKGSKSPICRWSEEHDEGEVRFFGEEELHCWGSKDESIEALRKNAKNSRAVCILSLVRLKEARQKIEHLERRVEQLRDKKREIKYSPGNSGALEAQKHFELLAE